MSLEPEEGKFQQIFAQVKPTRKIRSNCFFNACGWTGAHGKTSCLLMMMMEARSKQERFENERRMDRSSVTHRGNHTHTLTKLFISIYSYYLFLYPNLPFIAESQEF
jgi:hypothetical protein